MLDYRQTELRCRNGGSQGRIDSGVARAPADASHVAGPAGPPCLTLTSISHDRLGGADGSTGVNRSTTAEQPQSGGTFCLVWARCDSLATALRRPSA